MVDLTGIDIHAPQQTHPKCSTRASGLWPSPPFNANIVFRGRRQPFISNYIVNCYTSSYYAILLYCSMLQHVAVSYSIHSITPSPDILTISRHITVSLDVSGSRLQSSVRSISVKPWPGHLATNVTSAWDQCLCLIQTWRNLNLIQYLYRFFTYLYRFFTISILALGLCSSIMLQLMGCASVWLWLPANKAGEQFQQWLHKGDDFLHASLSFLNQPACSFIFSDKAKEQSQDIGA